jgi:hypothetical protein
MPMLRRLLLYSISSLDIRTHWDPDAELFRATQDDIFGPVREIVAEYSGDI